MPFSTKELFSWYYYATTLPGIVSVYHKIQQEVAHLERLDNQWHCHACNETIYDGSFDVHCKHYQWMLDAGGPPPSYYKEGKYWFGEEPKNDVWEGYDPLIEIASALYMLNRNPQSPGDKQRLHNEVNDIVGKLQRYVNRDR